MSSSDGNSTTRPLRRRTSKRFDRSGGSPLVGGSSVIDDAEEMVTTEPHVEVPAETEAPTIGVETIANGAANTDSDTDADADAVTDPTRELEGEARGEVDDEAGPGTALPAASGSVIHEAVQSRLTDSAVRNRTLDELTSCGRCGHEVSSVNIEVDGNVLIMESCDNCDTRRWQLAGERIELQQALDHVGEHAGRRR